jgi:ArsR family transcriptional regulator
MFSLCGMPPKTENPHRLKARIFYALSDPVRLDILEFLRDGEKCVCEIIPHVKLIQPVVSRHLKILKECGIVRCRKDGNKRLYSITDQRIFKIIDGITPELVTTFTAKMLEQIL